MKKYTYISFLVVCVFVGTIFFVKNVQAARVQLFTISGFIDTLIEKGIIDVSSESKARDIATMVMRLDKEMPQEDVQIDPEEKVEVTVSQLIEHGALEYNTFEDIKGLLLLVENVSDEEIVMEAKRGCQVVYKIYDENNAVVFDLSGTDKCKTEERVTYTLQSGQTRMFQISHKMNDKKLSKGTYRVEIEYPGYGGGTKTITVQ